MGPDEPLATTGNTAGLPDVSAPDGDVVMTDDINSAHRGNKVPQVTTNLSFLSPNDSSHLSPTEASLVEKSAPNTSPDDASTTSPDSSALAASPSADCLQVAAPAASQSQDSAQASPPILASSHLPSNNSVPAFLTPAILSRLRAVSPATAWQDLVTAYLQYELASPPTGVSFDFAF